jgi:hypothetical protein
MLSFFPLLALVVVLANLCMFVFQIPFDNVLFAAKLPSGGALALSVGDGFIVLALVLLYLEVWKAGRPRASTLDHGLSLVLFVVCLIEFLLVEKASHSAFLILTLITLLDVIAGFTVSMSAARRDVGVISG